MFRVDAGFDRLGPDERKKMRQEKLKPLMGRRGDEGSAVTRADVWRWEETRFFRCDNEST